MEKSISLPVLGVGIYLLSEVFLKRHRNNWSGTKIKMGPITNLGTGIFFVYGASMMLFVPLPFETFIEALIFAIIPMLGSFILVLKGYKIDVENHKKT